MEHRTKSPDAVYDFTIDWAVRWLAPGEKLTASTWFVPPELTKVGNDTHDDTTTTIRLSGGSTRRTFYTIFNHVVSDQGHAETDGFILEVVID